MFVHSMVSILDLHTVIMVKVRDISVGDILTQRAIVKVISKTKKPGYVTVAPVESIESEYNIQNSVFATWDQRAEGYEESEDTYTPGLWSATHEEKVVKLTPSELASRLKKETSGIACKLQFLKKPDFAKNIAALQDLARQRFKSVDDHKKAVADGIGISSGKRSAKKVNADIAAGLRAFADQLEGDGRAELRKIVLDSIVTGERREMTALYQGHDQATGGLIVTDVEKLAETGNWRASRRSINPSTVQYFIFKGTRYELKHPIGTRV